MLKPVKPFNLELPYDNANYYVELNTNKKIHRVSTILSAKDDQDLIKRYHAEKVGEINFPDYNRADFLREFSCLFGTIWHLELERKWELFKRAPLLDNVTIYEAYPEVTVINWEYNYAGTFDFLYRTDKGWVLRDYKTHSRFYRPSLEFADVGVWELDRDIQSLKMTKWRKQLIAYVKAIKSCYGIDVEFVEIVCKNIHTGDILRPIQCSVTKLTRAWNGFLDLNDHLILSTL